MTPLDLAGRAAALVLTVALTANTLLVAVSPDNTLLEYGIVFLSSIASIFMLMRLLWPLPRFVLLSPLLSAVVWGATFLNIPISHWYEATWQYKARQGGFFMAFFLASLSLYYVEKMHFKPTVVKPEEAAVPDS